MFDFAVQDPDVHCTKYVYTCYGSAQQYIYRACITCLACTLPSLHLVSVVFGTAIPISLYIFENVLYTCIYNTPHIIRVFLPIFEVQLDSTRSQIASIVNVKIANFKCTGMMPIPIYIYHV